jgi:branched-subunit amino acid aminotransferase/4-amino-4-deoxychorismate lyase
MKATQPYIDFNGTVQSGMLPVTHANRALQYGDGVFETMHYHNGKILFGQDHFDRLKLGLEALKIKLPAGFSMAGLIRRTGKLLLLNKISGDARIRLQVMRNDGGSYTPVSRDSSYMLTVSKLESTGFEMTVRGLKADIFDAGLPQNFLSNHKTCNALPYVMAGIYAAEKKLDDCLLINASGRVAEAISSNVFMVRRGIIFTPPLRDGCVAGVMRKNLLGLSASMKFSIREKSLTIKDLLTADEIFLTNVIQGIRWVEFFRNRKKKNEITSKLLSELQLLPLFHQ